MGALRVLQVIGDTDRTDEHLAALRLHAELVASGAEVRTLALAPGRDGGLDSTVPVIAPGRRSLAARSGMATERKWADVVVLHGGRACTYATAPRRHGGPPTVVAVQAPTPGRAESPDGFIGSRVIERAALVVTGERDAQEWMELLGSVVGSSTP